MRLLVAEELKLEQLSSSASASSASSLFQTAERQHAPRSEAPPAPLGQGLSVDQNQGLGADILNEQRGSRAQVLGPFRASDLFQLLLALAVVALVDLRFLDRELDAPDAEEAGEGEVIGGASAVGDGDEALGFERGCWRRCCFFWWGWRVRERERERKKRKKKKKKRERSYERDKKKHCSTSTARSNAETRPLFLSTLRELFPNIEISLFAGLEEVAGVAAKKERKKKKRTAQVDDGLAVAAAVRARPLSVQAPEHRRGDAEGSAASWATRRAATLRGEQRAGNGGAEGESHVFGLIFFFFLQAAGAKVKSESKRSESFKV